MQRGLPFLLMGVLVLGTGLGAGLGLSETPSAAGPGSWNQPAATGQVHSQAEACPIVGTSSAGFAGYRVQVPVRDVAGSFAVPEVLTGSNAGTASTWIGVQTGYCSFLQLGVTESSGGFGGSDASSAGAYDAFWSDTTLHYRPRTIAVVQGGDRVSVALSRGSGGWVLSFQDDTQGWSKAIASHFARGATFQVSDWTQEDPVSSLNPYDNLPYPSLSETSFSGMKVNGRTPKLDRSDGIAMDVLNGPILVPTAVASGDFSIDRPTLLQQEYLSVTAPAKHFTDIFFGDLQSSSLLAKSLLRTDERQLRDATRNLNYQIADSSDWGGITLGPDVADMAIASLAESSDLSKGVVSGLTPATKRRLYADAASVGRADRVVRAYLGLPPY